MENRVDLNRKEELLAGVRDLLRERYAMLHRPAEPWIMFCLDAEEEEYTEEERLEMELRARLERARREETFSQMLLRVIQEKELTEPEVYNSVFMDRRLFNKIRNTPEYQPSKRTALLLAVALKLNWEETEAFLRKAGYEMLRYQKADVIVEYFIESGNYNIFEINEVLEAYRQPLLMRCD